MTGPGLSRRQALLAAVGASLAQFAGTGAAFGQVRSNSFAPLDAFIDVLLPADAASPAASALGIGADIRAFAADSPLYLRLLTVGCDWLDGLDARPFADLPAETQTAIVTYMSTANFNEVPRRFYHLTRQVAVEFYYARPEAIAGFPLADAPQPAGYPPPWG